MRIPTPKQIGPRKFRIRIFYNHPETGERTWRSVDVHGNRRHANKIAKQLAHLRDAGLLPTADLEQLVTNAGAISTPTAVRAASAKQSANRGPDITSRLNTWLGTPRVQRLAAKTRDDYHHNARRYIEPHLGSLPLARLTTARVDTWLARLEAQGLAPRTRKYALDVLRMALDEPTGTVWATNPARAATTPSLAGEKRRATTMTEAEYLAYQKVLTSVALDIALRVCLTTGARPGEVLALQPQDLETRAGVPYLHIQRALDPAKGRAGRTKPTKTNRTRLVPLIKDTARALRGLAHNCPPEAFLFTTSDDRPYAISTLRSRHANRLRAAGITRHLRLYDLRHSHASLLLRSGAEAYSVSKRLGHTTVAYTMDTYVHELDSMQTEANEQLEAMLAQVEENEA